MLDLPGPSNLVDRVQRDLEAGLSVVLVFPRSMIDSGLADEVVDSAAAAVGAAMVEAEGSGLEAWIVRALGRYDDWRPSHDPLWDLAHWPALGGLAVAVRSWEHDLARLLSRWEPLTHEASRSPVDRFRFLMAVEASDLAKAGLERQRPLHMSVHWWWGTVDRIDTDLHLRRSTRVDSLDRLHHEQRVETVAWDLGVADLLPIDFAGHIDQLASVVPDDREGTQWRDLPEEVREHQRPSGLGRLAPPVALRELWDCGEIELWDGRFRPRLRRSHLEVDLDRLLWRAQVRAVFPYLEEHRRQLLPVFLHYAGQAGHAETEDDPWELGDMVRAVRQEGVRLPLDRWEHLRAARVVRNDLAHGRPASPRHLRKLLEFIPL